MSRIPPDVRRGRLQPDELEQIVDLSDRLNAGQIARALNRHPVTISYAMHRLGVRQLTRRTFAYTRKGVFVRSFSAEEDALLLSMRVAGCKSPEIARALTERFGHPRSAHTVLVRLVLLSNLEEAA